MIRLAFLFLTACGALLLGGVAEGPNAVERGGVIAFMIWVSAPLGAVALALIHTLTGGRWLEASFPVLRAAAASTALAPFVFAALLPGLAHIYPWAAQPTIAGVAQPYLNPEGFAARGLVALAAWAAIGLFFALGRLSALGSALALVFHGVAISFVAVDWGLSLDLRYSDSAFAAEFAVQQLMLALALSAVLQPRRAIAGAGGDVGALLLVTALAAFYLGLMTFIVKWYGDQPADVAWTLARAHGVALVWLTGAIVFGALAPIVALSWRRVRETPRSLRLAGASASLGVAFHDLWWLCADAASALIAALALTALGCASLLFVRMTEGARLRAEVGYEH